MPADVKGSKGTGRPAAKKTSGKPTADAESPTPGCTDALSCGSSRAPKSTYVPVGSGQGDYEKVIDHVFVGPGGGEWLREEIEIHYGWKPRKCTLCFVALFAILIVGGAVCYLFAMALPGGEKGGMERASAAVMPEADGFDCHTDFDEWMSEWTPLQKDWCCKYKDRGCPTTEMPNQFDCDEDRSDWKTKWPDAKKAWCCGFSLENCADEGSFKCEAKGDDWKSWPWEQKSWCCGQKSVGCEVQWDCETDLDKADEKWGKNQQAWCCAEKKKGCKTTSTTSRKPGLQVELKCDNVDQMTPAQKSWCCQNEGVGCSEECKSVCVFDRWASTCSDRIQWSAKNQAPQTSKRCDWAHSKVLQECDKACMGCKVEFSGCMDTDPYNCNKDLLQAEIEWSPGKKAWCCLHEQKGCTSEEEKNAEYSCGGETKDWSHSRLSYCCRKEAKGCDDLPDLFDCADDLSKWETEWPASKKEWCCTAKGKGCDCKIGLASWKTDWSTKKKEVCCEETKKEGCEIDD